MQIIYFQIIKVGPSVCFELKSNEVLHIGHSSSSFHHALPSFHGKEAEQERQEDPEAVQVPDQESRVPADEPGEPGLTPGGGQSDGQRSEERLYQVGE